jgi:hypothetical protein
LHYSAIHRWPETDYSGMGRASGFLALVDEEILELEKADSMV